MDWYYVQDGQQVGPMTEELLREAASSGKVTADTLIWHDGMAEWAEYGSVMAAGDVATRGDGAADDETRCCECDRSFPLSEMIEYEGATVCGECKPKFFQRVEEGGALPGVLEYGSFGIRLGAKFLDGLILGAVNMVISLIAGGMGLAAQSMANNPGLAIGLQAGLFVVQTSVGAAYTMFFLGKFGATPGKMACRLKVIRPDGGRITYKRALARHFSEILSAIILYIGYIMAGFDDEKRTLHDRICDTRVIKIQK